MERPYLFAGDREIALRALRFLIDLDDVPAVLCVSDRASASHGRALEEAFRASGGEVVIRGAELRTEVTLERLRSMNLDFAISVHFPDIVRRAALDVPTRGWLNLHPAYLPFNRGWHTPSWAILEGTPAGVTLHEMVEEVDAGAILAQRAVSISPADTAHTLYGRLLDAEFDLLRQQWPRLRGSGRWPLSADHSAGGTAHESAELHSDAVQRLDLEDVVAVGALLDRLRALTTNRWNEAAYFESGGRRYRVRVELIEDVEGAAEPESDE